jgi:hypothetical protein
MSFNMRLSLTGSAIRFPHAQSNRTMSTWEAWCAASCQRHDLVTPRLRLRTTRSCRISTARRRSGLRQRANLFRPNTGLARPIQFPKLGAPRGALSGAMSLTIASLWTGGPMCKASML